MSMKMEILEAIEQYGDDYPTSEQIIDQVHRQSGIGWKGSSIRKSLGRLVSSGDVVNLDRDPTTGYYHRIPCRYGLAL